jgi:hypothetical protein
MHYRVVFDSHSKAHHQVDTHALTMNLFVASENGDEHVQYFGGYVTGPELLDLQREANAAFWSAVALNTASMLERGMRRNEADIGTDDAGREQLLAFPVDVRRAEKLASSGAELPALDEGAVILEFEISAESRA